MKEFAFNGAVSNSYINNETDAKIVDSKADASNNATEVTAKDSSKIDALSGGAAVAVKGAGVGIALSRNRITGSTKAHVSGNAVGGSYNLKGLKVLSDSQATMNTIAVGIGGGKDVGIAGSITTNFINNDVLSYIDDDAIVIAQNNVGVIAQSADKIAVGAGSLGIGLGGAGIGVSFTVNSINSNTKAYIDDAQVTGLAKNALDKISVYSGELEAGVKLAEKLDLAKNNGLVIRDKLLTENVTGVAVNATAVEQVENISANISGGKGLAAGLVESINIIGGSTQAYVLNSQINNQNKAEAQAGQDVAIKASNIAYANSFIGGVSVSGGGAGGAGADLHAIISYYTRFCCWRQY